MLRVIGMKSPLRFSVEAKTKSDQAHRKANEETVRAELRLTGRTIERKVRHAPAPSTRAACNSSRGIPDMKAVNSSTANGTAMVESATINPQTLLSRPRLL